jgi:hypothetical protein
LSEDPVGVLPAMPTYLRKPSLMAFVIDMPKKTRQSLKI